jgi:hypothetical protein
MTARLSPSSRALIRSYFRSFTVPPVLGVFCFLIYNANLRQIGAGDTFPARYQPLILWHEGTLGLNTNVRLVGHGHLMIQDRKQSAIADGTVPYFEPQAYWMIYTRHNQRASLYPLVTPLLVALL